MAADLGYEHRPANRFQRLMQRFGSSKPGAWFFSKSLQPLDTLLARLTKGRTSMPEVMAGLPVLFVTTTGRRSGQPRECPLIAVPIGDTVALLGTNFGQRSTPAWVFNLEADPSATVRYRGREVTVRARPATDDERASVWDRSVAVYPGYRAYQDRITGREVRIFVLEPAAAA